MLFGPAFVIEEIRVKFSDQDEDIFLNADKSVLATGHNCRIASVAALECDAQYFIIWNIGDHCLNFSINMIGFEKVSD